MSMFIFAISCMTASNLSWFMDPTSQIPMQYCSLQHRTLLPSPFTSTTEHCFHFGSASSFFLELFLLFFSSSILGIYWPGDFIFQCHIFLPFHTVHGTLKKIIFKWFAIPFSSGPHINIYVYRSTIYNSQNEQRVKIPINKWMDKLNLVYTKEYYSAIKNYEVQTLTVTWMNLENIMLSERSQTQKDKYCVILFIWNIQYK